MSNTLFFDLTFGFEKKKRVTLKKQIALFLSSNNDKQVVFGKEPKIKVCPNCQCSLNTTETPGKCPSCGEILC